jgi:hypothetical protein
LLFATFNGAMVNPALPPSVPSYSTDDGLTPSSKLFLRLCCSISEGQPEPEPGWFAAATSMFLNISALFGLRNPNVEGDESAGTLFEAL